MRGALVEGGAHEPLGKGHAVDRGRPVRKPQEQKLHELGPVREEDLGFEGSVQRQDDPLTTGTGGKAKMPEPKA